MTAPSSTPGSSGESSGDEPRGAVGQPENGLVHQVANQPAPRTRRERRERERGNRPVRVVPAQTIPIGEDGEAPEDDDLRAVTPPPRPAPRADAFKGLHIIEHRPDPDEAGLDETPDERLDEERLDEEPPNQELAIEELPIDRVDDAPLDAGPAPEIAPPVVLTSARKTPAKRMTPRPAAAAFHDLAPALWPSNDTFAPVVKKKPPVRKSVPRAAKKTAAVPEPAAPAPEIVEPIAELPVAQLPVAELPEPELPVAELPEPELPEVVSVEPESPAAELAAAEPADVPPLPIPELPPVPEPPLVPSQHEEPAPAAIPVTTPAADNPADVLFPDTPRRRAEAPIGTRAAGRPRTTPPMGAARRLKAALFLVPILSAALALAGGLLGAITLMSHPLIGTTLLVAAVVVLVLVVLTATEANRAIPQPLIGSELNRVDHVALWAAVTTAADELGVETPVRIVVDGAARVALSRRPSGNELAIGLPLLLGLSEPELSALLIHELAHDALPGAAVHRLGERIEATIRGLNSDRRVSRRPTLIVMRGYGHYYRWLATKANERHELHADDLAARLTSTPITAQAIQRADVVRDRWQTLVTQYVPLAAIAHRRAPLGAGLQSLLAAGTGDVRTDTPATRRNRGESTPRDAEETDVRPSFDAHQTPAQRAERLTGDELTRDAQMGDVLLSDEPADRPATTMLGRGDQDVIELERAMLPDGDPEPADWQTIVEIAAQHQVHERTAHLAWAMREVYPDQKVTLAAVLAAIADGNGHQLVGPLLAPGLPARERPAAAQQLLERLITAYVVMVLLRGGRARHEVAWPGGIRLLRRSGNRWIAWDGGDPIRSGTADPAGIAALTRWLRDVQADLDVSAEGSAGPPHLATSALSDLDLVHAFETSPVDLLTYRTGMLLARIGVPTPAARLAQQATQTIWRQSPASVATRRILQLAEQLGEAPQDLPGGWWIPFSSMVSSEIWERRSRTEIRLRLDGGVTVVLQTTNRTSARGRAMEDLDRVLPGNARG